GAPGAGPAGRDGSGPMTAVSARHEGRMTSPLRVALLLLTLSALATAAPAPLPREKRLAEPHPWSAPVDGLRIRLMAPQTRYRVGDTVRLVLEIQNVSGSTLTLEKPRLSRFIDPPSYGSRGWAITAEKLDRGDGLEKDQRMLGAEGMELVNLVRLEAGGTLRIEIDASQTPDVFR